MELVELVLGVDEEGDGYLARGCVARHVLDVVRLVEDDDGGVELEGERAADGGGEQVVVRADDEVRVLRELARREVRARADGLAELQHVLDVPHGVGVQPAVVEQRLEVVVMRAAAVAAQQPAARGDLAGGGEPADAGVDAQALAGAQHGDGGAVRAAGELGDDLRDLAVRAGAVDNLGVRGGVGSGVIGVGGEIEG